MVRPMKTRAYYERLDAEFDKEYGGKGCPNWKCGDCIHHKWNRNKAKYEPCPRLDHDKIQFAKPWFKSYDANQHSGIICSDFYPNEANYRIYGYEGGFEYYWKRYVKYWLPYSNVNIYAWFIQNGDTSIRYGVPLLDFVYGKHLTKSGKLKAKKRMFYKQSRSSPTGYILVRQRKKKKGD